MKPVIDLEKEYGIVLEGGGAKGAYQIGAWKALQEAGVKIKGISGTSVGALNGALMCMGDLKKAEEIWENISYSKIMDVDDKVMDELLKNKLKVRDFLELGLKYVRDGGIDVTPLKQLISEAVDPEKIRNSPMDFFVQTFHVDSMQELHVNMKELEPDMIKDMLLASAYMFPVFKTEKLHGNRYLDGGLGDNVPIHALLEEGYQDIIVIRIFGIGFVRPVRTAEEINLLSVQPRVDLGTIMDFDPEKSRKNMAIGYFDTMRMIYGLEGKSYYIDQEHEEAFFMNKLASMKQEGQGLRWHMEKVLPKIAAELKLGTEWDYTELYLTMLEAAARLVHVPKYKIYTVEGLQIAVKENGFHMEPGEKLPQFAGMILNS